jgi:hypothetical protein
MAAAMSREESYAAAFERAHHDGVRRVTEWRLYVQLARIAESGHGVKAAAADNPNLDRLGSSTRFL